MFNSLKGFKVPLISLHERKYGKQARIAVEKLRTLSLCVVFVEISLLFYSMILIIVCYAIVPATTTFYLFIACKGRTVDLKESCFRVLFVPPTTDDSVCICSTRCATSLHKNMLNIRVELFWIDDSFARSWKDDLDDLHRTTMTHAMTFILSRCFINIQQQ